MSEFRPRIVGAAAAALVLTTTAALPGDARSRLAYPPARKATVVDDYNGVKVMPTYHPAFLLRNAQYKRAVWEDMQLIQRALGLR